MSMEEKNKKLSPVLESIREDIGIAGSFMQEFSTHVIDQNISRFPVYIASKDEVKIGRPFLSRVSHKLHWNYNASILEELVKKGIVLREKLEEFAETYGDPEERACIFVVLPGEGGFIFVPYFLEEDLEDEDVEDEDEDFDPLYN